MLKKNFSLRAFFFVLFLSCSGAAMSYADTIPPLSITGNFDAFYRYGFNKNGSAYTPYTTTHNAITLGLANVVFAKDFAKTGFVIDLMVGRRASESNYRYVGSGQQIQELIKQAYVYYKPAANVKITAGSFSTYFGYELTEGVNNLNYSMSYIFAASPVFHTGVKAEIAADSNWTVMAGIFDDNDTRDIAVKGLHLGGQVAYVNGAFKGYLNLLYGNADSSTTEFHYDVVLNYQATSKFGLGLNFSNKYFSPTGKSVSWLGTALYANYALSPDFTLAGRYEYFNDKDGVITHLTDNNISAFTLSGNIHLPNNLTLIPEIRFDTSAKNAYTDDSGRPSASETSVLLAAVYKF